MFGPHAAYAKGGPANRICGSSLQVEMAQKGNSPSRWGGDIRKPHCGPGNLGLHSGPIFTGQAPAHNPRGCLGDLVRIIERYGVEEVIVSFKKNGDEAKAEIQRYLDSIGKDVRVRQMKLTIQ